MRRLRRRGHANLLYMGEWERAARSAGGKPQGIGVRRLVGELRYMASGNASTHERERFQMWA